MIGMPIASGSLPWPTAVSLLSTVRHLDREGLQFKIDAPTGCSIVQWARSAVAGAFLKSDFTHLFWIDADIVWTPDDFFKLLAYGAVYDIVCATYVMKTDEPTFLINLPTPGKVEVNGHGLVRVNSLGIGFTLVKREVVEKIAATKPVVAGLFGIENPDIFVVDRTANGKRGEDVAFFDEAREQGYEVWLDPSIDLGHFGNKIYRGSVSKYLGLSTKETS